MAIFEFVIGLYAIIAGLGISLLVHSIGEMIEGRRRLRLYWVQTVWIALILAAHISSWFTFWHFSEQQTWTPLDVMLVLSVPILLYLVSHLAVPNLEPRHDTDLRAYYFEHHRWMQGLLITSVVLAQASQYLILGRTAFETPDIARTLAIAFLLPGLISRAPWVHATQAVLLATLMLLGLSFVFTPIG